MNPREMRLLVLLLGVLGLGGGAIVFFQGFVKPLKGYNVQIARLHSDIDERDFQLQMTQSELKDVERARLMSLSPSLDSALAEYGSQFLAPLLSASGLEVEDFRGTETTETRQGNQPAGTVKAAHRILSFQIRAKGELGQLAHVLEGIKKTPLVHRVRSLTIERVDKTAKRTTDRLNIALKIEAMMVNGAEPHVNGPLAPDQWLLAAEALLALHRGPTGVALLPWVVGPTGPFARQALAMESGYRQYGDLDRKNIFRGADPRVKSPEEVAREKQEKEAEEQLPDDGIEVADYIRLDTADPDNREAFFRNLVFKAAPIRLRSASWSGFNTFRVQNEWRTKTLFTGKVLRIDQRDVYFQVMEDVYGIHLGQSLGDAMRHRMRESELEKLGLTRLVDKTWGEKQRQEFLKEREAERKKKATAGR